MSSVRKSFNQVDSNLDAIEEVKINEPPQINQSSKIKSAGKDNSYMSEDLKSNSILDKQGSDSDSGGVIQPR